MQKSEIKKLINTLSIKSQKRLGQYFLIDEKVVKKMIDAANLSKKDIVLEIGPGFGILTKFLATKAKEVLALEKDEKLCLYLSKKFKGYKNVRIICGDILRIPHFLFCSRKESEAFVRFQSLDDVFRQNQYKIIANLPFYLTSHFLRLFLEMENKPSLMVLLIQKEVAKRIVAKPGKTSLLSISCQFYGQPEIVALVLRKAFYPVPDVDGAILKIKVYPRPKFDIKDLKLFFRIIKAGFAGRRKQLHNTLAGGLQIPNKKIKEILISCKIDPTRRAQTLSLSEWVKLYEKFEKLKTKKQR